MPSSEQLSPLLGDMEITHFMENYWQKKPCILRQVLSAEQCQLFSVDELAGFALEDAIESRLVLGKPGEQDPDKIKVSHGPFSEKTLTTLPEQDWTLLLQSVDIWLEQYQSFLSWVNFLPRWRLDDIMVSIAAPGGGVGPHRDQYDVFLIHTEGERRWKVSAPSSEADDYSIEALVQVPPFEGEIDEIFKAGDVLYLPPGWLHWGIANTLAVTCSIGFRAPSAKDLLISVTDQVVENGTDSYRYSDEWRKASIAMNISSLDIEQVKLQLSKLLNNDRLIAEALGKQVTQSKLSEEEFIEDVADTAPDDISLLNCQLKLHPASRMSYFTDDSKMIDVYLNGETFQLEYTEYIHSSLNILSVHQPIMISETEASQINFLEFLKLRIVEGTVCIL